MGTRTAKLFMTGRSQAVRLPAEFRFEGSEVFIRRDPRTGNVILSRKPDSWDGLFDLYGKGDVPDDFLGPSDRSQPPQDRDPLEHDPEKPVPAKAGMGPVFGKDHAETKD